MSAEGPRCRSEAATCNQGRSEKSPGELERLLPNPDGITVARGRQELPQPT